MSAVGLVGLLLGSMLAVTVGSASPAGAILQFQGFAYTGATQTWTVPAGVTSITFDARGAEGGCTQAASSSNCPAVGGGGPGAKVTGRLAVTPGTVVSVNVGGAGSVASSTAAQAGGWNGGGSSGISENGSNQRSGSGGGATDIRIGGTSLADRKVVAGGGGGNASTYSYGGRGGQVGQAATVNGSATGQASYYGGFGGNAVAGGSPVNPSCSTPPSLSDGSSGALGLGGNGGAGSGGTGSGGGGGGGGYYGGSGGGGSCGSINQLGGGGGGSSFVVPSATNVLYFDGSHNGNGFLTIYWDQAPAAKVSLISSANGSFVGEAVEFSALVTVEVNSTSALVTAGTVAFTADGTIIPGCEAVALDSSGQARCTTSSLPIGASTIVATYTDSRSPAQVGPGSATLIQEVEDPTEVPVVFAG